MPWMYIDLWFTVGDFSNVQYQTFDDGRFIFVHVARATRDDRDVSVPRVREAAVVTLNVIGEAFPSPMYVGRALDRASQMT